MCRPRTPLVSSLGTKDWEVRPGERRCGLVDRFETIVVGIILYLEVYSPTGLV